MNPTEMPTLEQQAAALREIATAPTEREVAAQELARIEAQIAEQQAATAKAEAEKRMLGITRAHGSLRSSLETDVERIRAKLTELGEAITVANDRYRKLLELDLEARDLSGDFGLPRLSLPRVLPPAEVFKTARPQADVRLITLDDHARLLREHAKERERAAAQS